MSTNRSSPKKKLDKSADSSKLTSMDLSQDQKRQEISEMMMGNDCIIVWLGNEKDDTFYGRAKKKLKLD